MELYIVILALLASTVFGQRSSIVFRNNNEENATDYSQELLFATQIGTLSNMVNVLQNEIVALTKQLATVDVMKNQINQLNKLVTELNMTQLSTVNELKNQTSTLNNLLSSLKTADNKTAALTQQVATLAGKRCYIATSSSIWGVCPFGGDYAGGFSVTGSAAGIGEQNRWTGSSRGFTGFLCC